MQDFHTTVLFDISCTADEEIRYQERRERSGGVGGGGVVGVLKLQKDTYTGEITGEFSRGK